MINQTRRCGGDNMNKIFVLDTNVLLHDPNSIFSFKEHEVVIPAVVLEEIDSKKRNADEIGRNARTVSRLLDGLRELGHLHSGVELEHGGKLKVELNHRSFVKVQEMFGEVSNDNRILAVALNYLNEENEKPDPRPVVLVSKDVLVRIKADVLGITPEDYLSDRTGDLNELYTGYQSLQVHPALIDEYYSHRSLTVKQLALSYPLYPHEFVMLLNDEIPLVTITGKAGTGKTLLALAAGLFKVEDEHKYKKLLIARPVVPMGKDIGYLPGEKDEKLRPWMQPIYDNLEFLFDTKKAGDIDKILMGLGSIQVEALTYIRGRSIPSQFIIIDEAQNLSRHEVKTIVSRAGEGSKVILMGDPEQIDHPYLDAASNGLSYIVEKFKQQGISGHITLEKGERSRLAQWASDLL